MTEQTQQIVALTGHKGSGKDTAATVLIAHHGFERVAFAGALKHMFKALLEHLNAHPTYIHRAIEGDRKEVKSAGLSRAALADPQCHRVMLLALLEYQGASDRQIAEIVDTLSHLPTTYFGAHSFEYMMETLADWALTVELSENSPRKIMQTLGTEWGRDMVHPDFWVATAERRMEQFDKVVVTDLRFPNELKFLRDAGAHIVRVHRPALTPDLSHVSEQFVEEMDCDCIIVNDQTMPLFIEMAEQVLIELLEDAACA